jgi:hypothetical protein
MEVLFGERPEWGYYWNPDKGHSQPVGLEKYTATYFDRLYSQSVAGINAGCFTPNPQNNCKAWCGVARFCGAVGGPEAGKHDPLFIS